MNCLQYGVWADCCNNCHFCLRMNRKAETDKEKIELVKRVAENIKHQDWKEKFSYGISLLGGELYYITDEELQNEFLKLIDVIIEYVFIDKNPNRRYSTVTNGLYNPAFLYRVIDKLVDAVGLKAIDVNFSYDLKYRYKNKDDAKLALKNINEFSKKYNYKLGVQMIVTQYLIDMIKKGEFQVNKWVDENIPNNILCFLYPHPVNSGKVLKDFNFKRNDFLWFTQYLKNENYNTYFDFLNSTKNSATFKYTGLTDRRDNADDKQEPILSDGKELINPDCGHSVLYQCYADSKKCMMCDLIYMEG